MHGGAAFASSFPPAPDAQQIAEALHKKVNGNGLPLPKADPFPPAVPSPSAVSARGGDDPEEPPAAAPAPVLPPGRPPAAAPAPGPPRPRPKMKRELSVSYKDVRYSYPDEKIAML